MNDMSSPLLTGQEMTDAPISFGIEDAHILRSKVIGKCAAVERWLGEQISTVEKPEMMLSLKIEQLRRLSDQGRIIFKRPQLLKERLESFRKFSDFRSEIVHSEMTLSVLDGTATVIFENAGQICAKMLRKKIHLPVEEYILAWQDMSKAANILITLTRAQPSSSAPKMPS